MALAISTQGYTLLGSLALTAATVVGGILTFVSARQGNKTQQTVAERHAETEAKAQHSDAASAELNGLRGIIQQQQDFIAWQDARLRVMQTDLDACEAEKETERAERVELQRLLGEQDADDDR